MTLKFEDFIKTVPAEHKDYVSALHEKLLTLGCTIIVKESKSGFLVSYQWNKKSILNWVFRKSGMLARIYGNNVGQYENLLVNIPNEMINKMTNARDCKRLLDPTACSNTCVKGLIFDYQGNTYKKCRNDAMLFKLSDSTAPYIQELVIEEVGALQ